MQAAIIRILERQLFTQSSPKKSGNVGTDGWSAPPWIFKAGPSSSWVFCSRAKLRRFEFLPVKGFDKSGRTGIGAEGIGEWSGDRLPSGLVLQRSA